MENYYDATIFHRLVPGFIVQGGDPTGTGMGGESIFGKPFKDEFHSRVRNYPKVIVQYYCRVGNALVLKALVSASVP